MNSYVEEFLCDSCGEPNIVEVDPMAKERYDITVYGEVLVKEFENRIEISRRDWDKYKPQIIAMLKQGDMKHATRSTETRKQKEYASA